MAASLEIDRGFAAERTRLGGASALVAAVALVVSAGVEGLVVGLQGLAAAAVVVSAWYLLPPTYAFALGNVALVAVLPETAVGRMVVVEAGLLGILLASATTLDSPGQSDDSGHSVLSILVGALVVLAWTLAGGAFAWASARGDLRLSVAGGFLIALSAFAAYGLHRYQLVSLGVVDESARGETVGQETARDEIGRGETSEQ